MLVDDAVRVCSFGCLEGIQMWTARFTHDGMSRAELEIENIVCGN